jgi:dTDP-4-dehydrorhamnose reductase
MLGRDVALAARAVGHEPIVLTRADLDICDREAAERACIEHYPGAVVNCAAWTNVDGARAQRGRPGVNRRGARNVAAAAARSARDRHRR